MLMGKTYERGVLAILLFIALFLWFINSSRFPFNEGWVNVWIRQLHAGVDIPHNVYPFPPLSFYIYFLIIEIPKKVGMAEFTSLRLAGLAIVLYICFVVKWLYRKTYTDLKPTWLLGPLVCLVGLFSSTTFLSYDYMNLYICSILTGVLLVFDETAIYSQGLLTSLQYLKRYISMIAVITILCLLKQSSLIGIALLVMYYGLCILVILAKKNYTNSRMTPKTLLPIVFVLFISLLLSGIITSLMLSNQGVAMLTGIQNIDIDKNSIPAFMDAQYKGGVLNIVQRIVLSYFPISNVRSILYPTIAMAGALYFQKISGIDAVFGRLRAIINTNLKKPEYFFYLWLCLVGTVFIKINAAMTIMGYWFIYIISVYLLMIPFRLNEVDEGEMASIYIAILLFIFQIQDMASAGISPQGYSFIVGITLIPIWLRVKDKCKMQDLRASSIR